MGPARQFLQLVATRLVLSLVLLFPTLAPAESGEPEPRVVDPLYAATSVTPDRLWVVGAFGTILHSTDAGRHWTLQPAPVSERLFGVAFADAQSGWAVGRAGTLLTTRDGGSTWQRQTPVSDRHLFHVAAIDARRAWAIGDWGTILQTEDGGGTWRDRSLDRDVILYAQSWPDERQGWIVGEMGTILHSADGGATWTEQRSGVEKTLFGITFRDATNGWACGLDGLLLRTKDGGESWRVVRGKAEVDALDEVGMAEAFENASLYDVRLDGRFGIAVGEGGTVLTSRDAGETWERVRLSGPAQFQWLRAVTLLPGENGVLVGAGGLRLRLAGGRIEAPGAP